MRKTRLALATLLTLATFAALTGTAKAQQFTIYGLEGFVLNAMGAPFWVQPYWSTIGAGFQDGLYENETVKILLPKSTPNGEFSTPTAASVTSLSSSVIPSTGTPYSSFGVWRQTITSLQQNFGLYSAGTVVPPDANWENEFAYTYVGKAWGIYQLGYQFYSSEGTVTINVQGGSPPSLYVKIKLPSNISGQTISFLGRATANPEGFNFIGSGDPPGIGEVTVENQYHQTAKKLVYLNGGGDALFYGPKVAVISGLLEATNTNGIEVNGSTTPVVVTVAFGACKGTAGC